MRIYLSLALLCLLACPPAAHAGVGALDGLLRNDGIEATNAGSGGTSSDGFAGILDGLFGNGGGLRDFFKGIRDFFKNLFAGIVGGGSSGGTSGGTSGGNSGGTTGDTPIDAPPGTSTTAPPTAPPAPEPPAPDAPTQRLVFRKPHYQLQNASPARIAAAGVDVAVIDPMKGDGESRFTRGEIEAARRGGRTRFLAYLSIGEAENYRAYWKKSWDANGDGSPDAGAPGWLAGENPDWKGNYKVRYWDPAWQSIVRAEIDRIEAAGFDGIYLDIVDGYRHFAPGGESGENVAHAERSMIEFVKSIGQHARARRKGFLVVPQNAAELVRKPEYLAAIDGIGAEDTWYDDDKKQDADHTRETTADLDRVVRTGKFVLATDYPTSPGKIADFMNRARAKGYAPFAGNRELDRPPEGGR